MNNNKIKRRIIESIRKTVKSMKCLRVSKLEQMSNKLCKIKRNNKFVSTNKIKISENKVRFK